MEFFTNHYELKNLDSKDCRVRKLDKDCWGCWRIDRAYTAVMKGRSSFGLIPFSLV